MKALSIPLTAAFFCFGCSGIKAYKPTSPNVQVIPSTSSGGNGSGASGAGAPSAPSSLNAQSASSVQIDLAWLDTSNDETGFQVERAAQVSGPFVSGPGSFVVIANMDANITSYHDLNLKPGTEYRYRVRAVKGTSLSAASNEAVATTPAAPLSAPTAPSNLMGQATAATVVKLGWSDNAEFKNSSATVGT
ncbi:MAG: fibronectin type III domain-containing protein [Bdellovibrionales bacterium]